MSNNSSVPVEREPGIELEDQDSVEADLEAAGDEDTLDDEDLGLGEDDDRR
jgi:hypothetical protein